MKQITQTFFGKWESDFTRLASPSKLHNALKCSSFPAKWKYGISNYFSTHIEVSLTISRTSCYSLNSLIPSIGYGGYEGYGQGTN